MEYLFSKIANFSEKGETQIVNHNLNRGISHNIGNEIDLAKIEELLVF